MAAVTSCANALFNYQISNILLLLKSRELLNTLISNEQCIFFIDMCININSPTCCEYNVCSTVCRKCHSDRNGNIIIFD